MISNTACPLDCYDACSIEYKDGTIKASDAEFTNGFLCQHLNHYSKYEQIKYARYNGEMISLEKALIYLKEIIKSTQKDKTLFYRGSGNFGLMQEISDFTFSSIGALLTNGSLCDGAGEAGILEGRGSNKNMPLSEIKKSEVIIVWGRNPHTTSSHLLPIIKDKTIIVIDPVKTKIASKADLFIQIKPHGDLMLAMLLSRFLYIEDRWDEEYLDKYASEYQDYYELTQTIRIKSTLDDIDVSLGQIGKLLKLTENKKVAIITGAGVQKYRDGADVLRAIDAFAVMLGLFDKEGCGVAYLGNSKEGIKSPFDTQAKRVSKVDTKFENFDTVIVQGANPLSQMPNSQRVRKSIEQVKNLVYFGLYENETSQIASLVIPAKTFLCKNDIRGSYSQNILLDMPKVQDCKHGISEYDLCSYLSKEFGITLESEEFYLKEIRENRVQNKDKAQYLDGFDTDDGEFIFLDEIDTISNKDDKLFLITPKSSKSLNSQFNREERVYLPYSFGFQDGEIVKIKSEIGEVDLSVKNIDTLRDDSILIYSGTKGLNNLTSSSHSYAGKNAIFQDLKVEISKLV